MIGTDIQTAIKKYVKASISDDDMILLINEAIDEIAGKGYIFGEVEVNAEANTWYEMPVECISVIDVFDSNDRPYRGWRQRGTLRLMFAESGTYTIVARRLADHILSLAEELPVHRAFHPALVTYGRAWKKLQINDESGDGNKLKQEFYQKIEIAYREISRRQPTQWKVIRHG
jgi:hypothetical protein